jgi:hypothetical protein
MMVHVARGQLAVRIACPAVPNFEEDPPIRKNTKESIFLGK